MTKPRPVWMGPTLFNKNPRSAERGFFVLEGAVAHATRGRDGRQEGRESGYYNLHRNLNDALFHASPPFG